VIRVRRYSDPFVAEQAAQWLRSHGVPAEVVGHHVQSALPIAGLKFTQLDVVVPIAAQKAEALRLLEEFDETPAVLDEDWETGSAPDLSLLDAGAFDAPCPSCGSALPLDAALAWCPSCGEGVDVVEVLVSRHGPEALAGCYAEEAAPGGREARGLDPVSFAGPCPSCGGTLAGMPVRGRCTRCGALYDKDEILRRGAR